MKRPAPETALKIAGVVLCATLALCYPGFGPEEVNPAGLTFGGIVLVVVLLSLWSWCRALQEKRNADNLPTQRIATAGQGYGEFYGTAEPIEGTLLLSPHFRTPCLWYEYQLIQYEREVPWVEHREVSAAPFLLKDRSGQCLIIPEGAQVRGVSHGLEAQVRSPRKHTHRGKIHHARRGHYGHRPPAAGP